jgi:outer membrane protein OmpA-like peptidoglycan-associated protein
MLKDYPALAHVAPAVVAPSTPPPLVQGEMVIVYFAVNSDALHDATAGSLQNVVARLQANPKARASISGYHSAAGDPAANHDLAKRRAMAVQQALTGAGVAESRVILEKPVAVQANVAGEDPTARRVEVTVR